MSPQGNFAKVAVISFLLTQGVAYLNSGSNFVLTKLAFFSIFFQWLVFIHASGLIFGNTPTEKFYDLTGAITNIIMMFSSISVIGIEKMSRRQQVLSLFVCIWAIRLGTFLFSRISKEGGVDSRFIEIKKSSFRFLSAWTIQGVWVFLTALPVYILNSEVDNVALGLGDLIGISFWIIGFLIEVIADKQKETFKKTNHGTFINVGLWSVSRHPNYFGEILLWIGVFITCAQGFTNKFQWIGILSPIFVCLLLIFISGM